MHENYCDYKTWGNSDWKDEESDRRIEARDLKILVLN